MKLYAVVIGRKERNTRYVAYHPDNDIFAGQCALAVYNNMKEAQKARRDMLLDSRHEDIHVVTFNGPEK